MKYNGSAENNKASKVTPLCLKVLAGVLCPGWGTTLQEGYGPTGNSPGNSDERAQNITYEGRLKELRLFRIKTELRGDAVT